MKSIDRVRFFSLLALFSSVTVFAGSHLEREDDAANLPEGITPEEFAQKFHQMSLDVVESMRHPLPLQQAKTQAEQARARACQVLTEAYPKAWKKSQSLIREAQHDKNSKLDLTTLRALEKRVEALRAKACSHKPLVKPEELLSIQDGADALLFDDTVPDGSLDVQFGTEFADALSTVIFDLDLDNSVEDWRLSSMSPKEREKEIQEFFKNLGAPVPQDARKSAGLTDIQGKP